MNDWFIAAVLLGAFVVGFTIGMMFGCGPSAPRPTCKYWKRIETDGNVVEIGADTFEELQRMES